MYHFQGNNCNSRTKSWRHSYCKLLTPVWTTGLRKYFGSLGVLSKQTGLTAAVMNQNCWDLHGKDFTRTKTMKQWRTCFKGFLHPITYLAGKLHLILSPKILPFKQIFRGLNFIYFFNKNCLLYSTKIQNIRL